MPLKGYTSQTDSILLAYIIKKVNFGVEMCTMQFQNFLLNEINNEESIKYNKHQQALSPKCFHLFKAKYCLISEHYTTQCYYKRIAGQVQIYEERINKNIEACLYHLPFMKISNDSNSEF